MHLNHAKQYQESFHKTLCNTFCMADLPKQVCVSNVKTAGVGGFQAAMPSDS